MGTRGVDLGVDVPGDAFLSSAREHGVSILGLSAFTTSSRKQIQIIMDQVKIQTSPITFVMAGGAALSTSVAHKLGADGYAKDAVGAVALIKQFLAANSHAV